MPNLRSTIESLASAFAIELVSTIRGMSLEEVLSFKRGASGPSKGAKTAPKAAKTSGAPKGAVSVDALVAIVRKHPNGIRAELLRKELNAPKKAFSYHTARAVESKRLIKKGLRRATTYYAGK